MIDEFEGFESLSGLLSEYQDIDFSAEIENIAKSFVDDLRKLPKPKSNIIKNTHTHLVDTFAYQRTNNDIVIGWGKYYGRMVETGTVKMNAQPHLKNLWESNKDKYFDDFLKRTKLK